MKRSKYHFLSNILLNINIILLLGAVLFILFNSSNIKNNERIFFKEDIKK